MLCRGAVRKISLESCRCLQCLPVNDAYQQVSPQRPSGVNQVDNVKIPVSSEMSMVLFTVMVIHRFRLARFAAARVADSSAAQCYPREIRPCNFAILREGSAVAGLIREKYSSL